MDKAASIIILHGPSSSGKSTLARALQARIELPFWHVSIDHLRDSGMLPMARYESGDFVWREHRAAFFDGFHRSLRAYAEAGNNLIVEHILDTPGWTATLADLLAPFDVFFVGLQAPLAELIRRETERGDRPIGDAERDFNSVHAGMRYDFEVSSEQPVDQNVAALLGAWRTRSRSAFFTLGQDA